MSRRSLGYNWEIKVKEILKNKGFVVERLGGTTTEMPDLVAHKDETKLIIGVECKSASGVRAPVPAEQIQRCIDEANKWGLYTEKKVLLAFQFGKYQNKHTPGHRPKKEYLKVWDFNLSVTNISCNYDGVVFSNRERIELEEFS